MIPCSHTRQDDLSHLPHHGVQYFWPYFETPDKVWRPLDLSRILVSSPGTTEANKIIRSETVWLSCPHCLPSCVYGVNSDNLSSFPMSSPQNQSSVAVVWPLHTMEHGVWKKYCIAPGPNCKFNCKANLWKVRAVLPSAHYKERSGFKLLRKSLPFVKQFSVLH